MVADELRRQADVFLDIVELQPKIGRDPTERVERAPREPRHTPQFLQRSTNVRPEPAPGRWRRVRRRVTMQAPFPGRTAEPGRDCPRCPRLVAFRETWRAREPGWFNAPVPSFGPVEARLLIVGLAPGLRGANRTGRPFTGDFAGHLLYATLKEFGFAQGDYAERADDGLVLIDARITNAVRCVPPDNKPLPVEIKTCREFLKATIAEMRRLQAIVALGRVAHDSVVAALGRRAARRPLRMARCTT